jgi:hypothetical protein
VPRTWVPHISLVFREMWDSANLNLTPIGLARVWGIELQNPTYRKKREIPGFPVRVPACVACAAFIKDGCPMFA